MTEIQVRYLKDWISRYPGAEIKLDPKCDELWSRFGLDQDTEEPEDLEDDEDPPMIVQSIFRIFCVVCLKIIAGSVRSASRFPIARG